MAALCKPSACLSLSSWISCSYGKLINRKSGPVRFLGASEPSYWIRQDRTPLFGYSRDLLPRHRLDVEKASWPRGARRKSSGTTKTHVEVIDDEDLRAGLNETVTEALKVMLAEDDKLLENFKEKVDFIGEFLVDDGQTEAARFMLVLRGMLDHEVYPQKDDLEGPYKKAFDSLWIMLEDSGWLLKQPGAEAEEAPVVDDDESILEIRYTEAS